jgi:hypothetical protein
MSQQRYSKKVATLIAHDVDKHGPARSVHTFVYQSVRGGYFTVTLIGGENPKERLAPVTMDEAILLFHQLPMQEVSFLDAFPVSA